MSGPATNEPKPKPGTECIPDLVLSDIKDRVNLGKQKYGTKLQANNGRNALWDLYQELIDAVMYVRQEITERDEMERVRDDRDFLQRRLAEVEKERLAWQKTALESEDKCDQLLRALS